MIIGLDYYKNTYNVQSETIIQPGLANMARAMRLLGEPQKAYNSIHLAGTNGKGSTLTYIKEMAIEHGLTVGTFMSPGIIDLHDQIQVNGEPITKDQLAKVFEQFEQAGLSGVCTDFELLTCAAFQHFRNVGVDVAIIEAGMGGRYDSTNVIQADIAVIPSIALEHTNFLGDTLEQIAYHKAGIVKKGSTVIVGEVPDTVFTLFQQEAKSVNANILRFQTDFHLKNESIILNNTRFGPFTLSMLGAHQMHNAALAVVAFVEFANKTGLAVEEAKIVESINRAQLPFRFEQVLPNIFLDGAHNPASIEKLVALLKEHFPNNKICFVLGMLADKDVKQVLKMLESISDDFYFMDIPNPRAMKAETLYELCEGKNKAICTHIQEVISQKLNLDEMIVITGSLYLLSSIRQQLLNLN